MEADKQCCACKSGASAFRFEERKKKEDNKQDALKPVHHEEYSHYSVNPTPQPIRIGPSVYGINDLNPEKPELLMKRIEAKA